MKNLDLGNACTLADCPEGLFVFHRDGHLSIGFKSEYTRINNLIEAHCFTTGEQFWGGSDTIEDQRNLIVYPIKDMDAIEHMIISHIRKSKIDKMLMEDGDQ